MPIRYSAAVCRCEAQPAAGTSVSGVGVQYMLLSDVSAMHRKMTSPGPTC